MNTIQHTPQKPQVPIQDAMAMVRFLANRLAKREGLEIGNNTPTLRPSMDLTTVLAQVKLPQSPEERDALQNYALMANIAYLYLKKHYEITH